MRRLIALVAVCTSVYAEDPPWIYSADRRERDGDIIHWGTGIDYTQEAASFKAEQMAIKSIVDECGGFAHKSIKIIKKYLKRDNPDSVYQAYALASIEYVACQYGKTPMAKTNPDVENPKLVEGQSLYKKLLQKPNIEVKQEIVSYQKSIDSLQQQIDELKNKPTNNTYHTTISVKQVTVVGSAAKYEECMRDYRDLLKEAGPNIADDESMRLWNKAQIKLSRCRQMKGK